MSFRQDGNEICVKYEQQKLVVKAIRDDIVNIFVPYRTKEHYSKAIDGDKACLLYTSPSPRDCS